jgi:hypothetical protein
MLNIKSSLAKKYQWNVQILWRAIYFGRQCHFKIWLDCHKFKKFPCLIMSMSIKCQKNEKKITNHVIQHIFDCGKDDQNLLLATVHIQIIPGDF